MIQRISNTLILLVLLATSTACTTAKPAPGNNNHTGIAIEPTPINIQKLTDLGRLWGFIKYYHANINTGRFNMDSALFRVLPAVLKAPSLSDAHNVMEKWVEGFGKLKRRKGNLHALTGVQVKLQPDYGNLFDSTYFSPSLVHKLAYILNNRDTGISHYYYGQEAGVGNPVFLNEAEYNEWYPSAEVRLLALFRFWNMIQYFYPNRHLTDINWNNTLPDLLPDFCNAPDTLAYVKACKKLIARLQDTHAYVSGESAKYFIRDYKMIPVRCAFFDNKLTVISVYDTTWLNGKIMVGDVIEQVNNQPVDSIINRVIPYTSASNATVMQAAMANMGGPVLTTPDSVLQLQILRNGTRLTASVATVSFKAQLFPPHPYRLPETDTPHTILPGNIGYFNIGKAGNTVGKLRKLFADTRGLIIDMRAYPKQYMAFEYGEWLKPGVSPFVTISEFDIQTPGRFVKRTTEVNGSKDPSQCYKGKIVLLVNSNTHSAAEYSAIALSSGNNATVMGSQTSGADGDISQISLPGGLYTFISGIGVLYPDGRETQRVGVHVDQYVTPTLEGARQHRDEVLEAAIKLINSN